MEKAFFSYQVATEECKVIEIPYDSFNSLMVIGEFKNYIMNYFTQKENLYNREIKNIHSCLKNYKQLIGFEKDLAIS